jgi:hypothetical protein
MARETWDQVRTFALGFPKAIEEFPWGETVIKVDHPPGRRSDGYVRGPMFLWLGKRDAQQLAVSVKLAGSYDQAVTIGRARPMTYSGLGKWGWLTVPLEGADVRFLHDWIDESYRNVAPRFLIAELGAT